MSLKLGKAFTAALRANTDLLDTLGADPVSHEHARIFMVARPEADEKSDQVPYVIIMPSGINTTGTEDDYDDETDTCTVGVLVVATTFNDMADLAEDVRTTIAEHLTGDSDFDIDDFSFQAGPVEYDPKKPCYFQTLTYIVNTQKPDENEQS